MCTSLQNQLWLAAIRRTAQIVLGWGTARQDLVVLPTLAKYCFLFNGRVRHFHWHAAYAWGFAIPNATHFKVWYKTNRFILEHFWKVWLTALNWETYISGLTDYVSFQTCMQHVADCASLTLMLSFAYCHSVSNIYAKFRWVHSFSSPYAQFGYCALFSNTMQGLADYVSFSNTYAEFGWLRFIHKQVWKVWLLVVDSQTGMQGVTDHASLSNMYSKCCWLSLFFEIVCNVLLIALHSRTHICKIKWLNDAASLFDKYATCWWSR